MDPTDALFGRLGVHLGWITLEQLNEATSEQGRLQNTRQLGQVLIDKGYLTPDQVQLLLQRQRQLLDQRGQALAQPQPQPQQMRPQTLAPAVQAPPPQRSSPIAAAAQAVTPSSPAGHPSVRAPRQPSAWLNGVLAAAVQQGASDVHVHAAAKLRLRVLGRLSEVGAAPLDPAQTREHLISILTDDELSALEQLGQTDIAYTIPNVGRFRGNIFEQQRGTGAAFRIIPARAPTLAELGLPQAIARVTTYHQGIVLFTGPAGCGKTATMAAILNLINEERRDHILTVEDPIEIIHTSKKATVNQRQAGKHTASFASALKGALREDPDIIVIGEMRDHETISMALKAAETGHLVMATLHTTSAIRTINRIIGVFPPGQQGQIRTMLSESLRAVISQRLCVRADGKGRVPALEVLYVNPAIGNLIRENRTIQLKSVLQTQTAMGMCLLDKSLAELLTQGLVTREEAMRHAEDPKNLPAAAAATSADAPPRLPSRTRPPRAD